MPGALVGPYLPEMCATELSPVGKLVTLPGKLDQLILRIQSDNYYDEDAHRMLWGHMEGEAYLCLESQNMLHTVDHELSPDS